MSVKISNSRYLSHSTLGCSASSRPCCQWLNSPVGVGTVLLARQAGITLRGGFNLPIEAEMFPFILGAIGDFT